MENYLEKIDGNRITGASRVSTVWDEQGIWVLINYAGEPESQIVFEEPYDRDGGDPREAVWDKALELAKAIGARYGVPVNETREPARILNILLPAELMDLQDPCVLNWPVPGDQPGLAPEYYPVRIPEEHLDVNPGTGNVNFRCWLDEAYDCKTTVSGRIEGTDLARNLAGYVMYGRLFDYSQAESAFEAMAASQSVKM